MTAKTWVNTSIGNHCQMESYSDRVEILLQQRGATKTWLARELGISRQALNQILRHNKKPKFVSEIALAFNVNPKWLGTGKGKAQITATTYPSNKPFFIKVYALSDLQKVKDLKQIKPVDRIIVYSEEESLSYLGVQLHNYPSMVTKFPDQCVLLFEMNTKPGNGDFVLVKKGKDFLFRQYFSEGKLVVLKPLNENFESITTKVNNCVIQGVLKETRIKF